MATRNPADTSQINTKCHDWYEPYFGKTAQDGTAIPSKGLTSAQVYGHDTWDDVGDVIVPVAPIQVEYPA